MGLDICHWKCSATNALDTELGGLPAPLHLLAYVGCNLMGFNIVRLVSPLLYRQLLHYVTLLRPRLQYCLRYGVAVHAIFSLINYVLKKQRILQFSIIY
jgi:hypothetical protein